MGDCSICGHLVVDHYNGVANRCRECHKKKVRENRVQKADYYKAYDRGRADLPKRVAGRRRNARKYIESGEHIIWNREWRKRNPEKWAAHKALSLAIRAGKIVRPSHCACGDTNPQAHHDDYSKALEGRWFCSACHAREHRIERAIARGEASRLIR